MQPLPAGIRRKHLLVALPVALAVAGCGSNHDASLGAPDGRAPVTVEAVHADDGGGFSALILPGRVRAREEVTLVARITGRLTALAVREGDRFRRGEVLARFDAPETREAVRSAREALDAATARLEQAIRDEARMESLYTARVVAKRDLELAQVERRGAEAARTDAQASLESWNENAAPTAPFDGVVARRHVDPGQTVTPGLPLLDLRSIRVGEIEAAVPESALPQLARATVSFQTDGSAWHRARLVRVDGMTDMRTRTRLAHFAPEDAGRLDPGAFARVRVDAPVSVQHGAGEDTDDASAPLSVPSRSLVRRGALTGVYVLRDGVARLRWLRVGRAAGSRVEVLAGLDPDDAFAASPDSLWDGRRVRIPE